MAQKTTYYNLNKYETNDPADLRKLSEGQDAIDLKLSKSTDMGYTDGGYLLGSTSLLSDYKYLAGDGFWYKLKSTTTSPYTHDASDTPDTVYLERITHKTTLDKVENLFSNDTRKIENLYFVKTMTSGNKETFHTCTKSGLAILSIAYMAATGATGDEGLDIIVDDVKVDRSAGVAGSGASGLVTHTSIFYVNIGSIIEFEAGPVSHSKNFSECQQTLITI